ncbi:MAG: hypothetical protein IJF11_05525 [Clostridia bacterium]|nr:hypothetical protein [Clostridia bacterium]
MDKISVTDNALLSARSAIEQFKAKVEALTIKCSSELNANIGNLDQSIHGAIQAFVSVIDRFNASVKGCVDENQASIDERLSRLPEYEAQIYKKRNVY